MPSGNLILTLCTGLVGGLIGGYLASPSSPQPEHALHEPEAKTVFNPFSAQSTEPAAGSDTVEARVRLLEQRLLALESGLQQNQPDQDEEPTPGRKDAAQTPAFRPVAPNVNNLVEAGISPEIADDIMRRMSQQEYRRLELQNLISRSSGSERRDYQTELRELNRNRISLRGELGDEQYDQYLYSSGQSNRVKVNNVMSGSPAESSGFETGDVILAYDGQKILSWPDIRKVTRQGEIGSYVDIEIMRNEQRMSIMVPRGTLGVQLDAVRLDPNL